MVTLQRWLCIKSVDCLQADDVDRLSSVSKRLEFDQQQQQQQDVDNDVIILRKVDGERSQVSQPAASRNFTHLCTSPLDLTSIIQSIIVLVNLPLLRVRCMQNVQVEG